MQSISTSLRLWPSNAPQGATGWKDKLMPAWEEPVPSDRATYAETVSASRKTSPSSSQLKDFPKTRRPCGNSKAMRCTPNIGGMEARDAECIAK
mmetsp:Transcript_6622/g.14448  ORF Transcript_6622/g.14448 Transcript_6622/m.14448 type:complete len:94 (-) Transcript_6622:484-765(-)